MSFSNSWRVPLPLATQAIRFIPIFILGVIILSTALLVTHARMPDPKIVPPLPDIGFELFTKIAWLEPVVDMCIVLLNVINVFVFFKLYLLHRLHQGRVEMDYPLKIPFLRRFLYCVWDKTAEYGVSRCDIHLIAWIRFVTTYFIIVLYRAVVIILTSYPATDNQCQHPQPITEPFKNVVITVVTLGSASIHCGDLMFSGHTIIITLSLMIQWIYGGMLHRAFRPISVAIILFTFYCIIASRSHYTDDVVVSLYVTAVTFIAMGHSDYGAPWQLQLLIRWWPCCGSNTREQYSENAFVAVVVEDDEIKA